MRAAIITPIPLLEKYAVRSNFHLVLAHLVLSSREYTEFYRWRSREGDYLLLDNGVAETGVPRPIEEIVHAAKLVEADEIILPDALFDMDRTLLNAGEAVMWLDCRGITAYRVMAVPQGRTLPDWLRCYQELLSLGSVESIGVSKFVADIVPAREGRPGGREAVVDVLDLLGLVDPNREYHLLGVRSDPLEVLRCSQRYRWLRSVDSCIAVMSGQQGLRFPDPLRGAEPYKRPESEFDFHSDSDPYPDITDENVRLYLGWAQGGVG